MLLVSLATPLVLLGAMLGMHAVERWLDAQPGRVLLPETSAPAVVTLPRQLSRDEAADRPADTTLTA